MAASVEFPVLLNPSLGFPRILPLGQNAADEPLFAIVASTAAVSGHWSLVPSPSNGDDNLVTIPLVQGETRELSDSPPLPSTVDETRDFVCRELLVEGLGGEARLFKVQLLLPDLDPETALRQVGGDPRATLYDLVLEGESVRKKPHAVCLTPTTKSKMAFVHLTDLHLARRNDLMEIGLAAVFGPLPNFNNMNDRMRAFIPKANDLADQGQLDLILIGGDLVDFVNHGVSDKGDEADNNWDFFREVLTGGGIEAKKGNPGLRVPVFTATGNHDWRLHPYDIADASSAFGITEKLANEFDWEYFDTVERLEAKKRDVFEKIQQQKSPIANDNLFSGLARALFQLAGGGFLSTGVVKFSGTWQAKVLVPVVTTLLVSICPRIELFSGLSLLVLFLAAGIYETMNLFLLRWLRKMVTHAIIPIEAGAQALHRYLLEINPCFNYAFNFGENHFIVMDTGPDCLTAQYLWDEGNKKMVRMSIWDNILGRAPDSMAFYPENEFYTYGQIAWLEKVLQAVAPKKGEASGKERVFLLVHAPPINVKGTPARPPGDGETLLKEGDVDIRYGTINHYLSQFFYLCLGKKEGGGECKGSVVDIVFAGHAHKKIEFRITRGQSGPLISRGPYSENVTAAEFDKCKPFVVQTAACGPFGLGCPHPPYYRVVRVGANGEVLGFAQDGRDV